jgi:hypothetical protein
MKKTTEKLEHESKYHMQVLRVLMQDIGVRRFLCEVKVCKGGTFNPHCIRLKQKAILANPNPVGFHVSDSAMDFGGSRGLDLVCSDYKYLCIVYLQDNKPHVVPIFMNSESLYVIKQSTKLKDLIEEYGSYPL